MFCKYCGNEIKEGNTFCTNCGKPIEDTKPIKKKSKKKYIIISIIILVVIGIIVSGVIAVPKVIKSIEEKKYQQKMQQDLDNISISLKQKDLILPFQGSYNEGLYENQFNLDLENITDYTKYEIFVDSYNGGALNITGNIDINKIGEYEVIYEVISEKGNKKSATLTIEVQDFMRPELNIANETIQITKGTQVNILEGITASDNVDNAEELTARIITEGQVDTNTVGEYTIKYVVKDTAGWSTERTRTYKVTENKNIRIGKEYTHTEYGSEYYMGSATSTICFTNNSKVQYYTSTGMDALSYSGTYTIKDGTITAKVEFHDLAMGDDSKTLILKIEDENTIKDTKTGYIYKIK